MNSKLCFNRAPLPRASDSLSRLVYSLLLLSGLLLALCTNIRTARANNEAPSWMHGLAGTSLPSYDEKTDAVVLYSEEILTVQPDGKMRELDREAFKILRPDGRRFGKRSFEFDSESRITKLHAWCIPAQGRDYEVKDKDAIEEGYSGVDGGELYPDIRLKVLTIPAADPGSIIGYEVEREVRPFIFDDEWELQRTLPVREARYTLQLPSGWEYKAVWLNHSEIRPTLIGMNQWEWRVNN